MGAALSDLVQRSLSFSRTVLQRRGVAPRDLPSLLSPFLDASRRACPNLVLEIEGMAEGAGVDFWELFAVNAAEELLPLVTRGPARADRCTGFAVRSELGTIVGHNEQWYSGESGNAAVVLATPEQPPAFASPTIATCLPAVGLNAAPAAQAIMSLVADDDGPGVPRVLTSRVALQAATKEEAVTLAAPNGRAGGYAHLYAFAGSDPFVVETSATGHAVLDRAAHTNHYHDPELATRDENGSEGSRGRLARVEELLRDRHRGPATPQDVMAILADHEAQPQPICVHGDPADDESDAIVFSMVCHVEERRMWVAEGNPCRNPFEEVDLTELFPR